MDRRTKILVGVFVAFVAYAVVASVVYPRWIKPSITIDDLIAERQEELDKLEDGETEVDLARREYRQFLDRIGSFDPVKVENDLRERLNVLVEKHGLEDVKTSGGSGRLNSFGKTGAEVMTLSVNGTGALASCLGFLKDLVELPHLIRLGSTAIYPASSSRRQQSKDRMYLRVPIEVLVLPQQRILGPRLTDDELEKIETWVRHDDRPYSEIWARTPFTPFEELQARAGRDRTYDEGASASLDGEAFGGHGDHTCSWAPSDGLEDPNSCKPKLNTSSPGTREYTLTVTDDHGDAATDTVTITVRERVAQKESEPEPEPEPRGPNRFKDGSQMQLCMALIRREGGTRLDEVMVYNSRSRKTEYFGPGDDFDGGTLVFVHPRGAVVRRQNADGEDDFFIYPIGANLTEDVRAEDAGDHPRLQAEANRIRELQSSALLREQADGAGKPAGEVPAATEPDKMDRAVPSKSPERPGVPGRRGANNGAPALDAGKVLPMGTDAPSAQAEPQKPVVVPEASGEAGDEQAEDTDEKPKAVEKKDDQAVKDQQSPAGTKAEAASNAEGKPKVDPEAVKQARQALEKRREEARKRAKKTTKQPRKRRGRPARTR